MIEFKNVTIEDRVLNCKIDALNREVLRGADPTEDLHYLAGLYKGAPVDFIAMMDDGDFVGYAYMINFFQASYLSLLAVVPEYQSMGYGSAMLRHLREMKGEKPIVLHADRPQKERDNYEQCIRRKWFYVRNGYVDQRIEDDESVWYQHDVYMNGFGIGYIELMALLDKVNMFMRSSLGCRELYANNEKPELCGRTAKNLLPANVENLNMARAIFSRAHAITTETIHSSL